MSRSHHWYALEKNRKILKHKKKTQKNKKKIKKKLPGLNQRPPVDNPRICHHTTVDLIWKEENYNIGTN
jgi:hypothetical protein